MEIERLHNMLIEAGIEHDWVDRNRVFSPKRDELLEKFGIDWGWQIIVRKADGEYLISAIEGFGTRGYRYNRHGKMVSDLIEIMDCTTPEDEVVGFLTAGEVLGRIKEALCGLT